MPPWSGILALVALIIGIATAAMVGLRDAATARHVAGGPVVGSMRAPIATLELEDGPPSAYAKAAVNVMSDGLRRSWVARIREGGANASTMTPPASYRIGVNEVDPRRLSIQIIDLQSGTILWTGAEQGGDDAGLRNRLSPVIAGIAGPFGVIARAETARLGDRTTGSYACILRYFAYLRARQPTEQGRVSACLNEKSDDPRLDATIGAVRAFLTLDSKVWADRQAQIATAERWARIAMQDNGDDAYAQTAMARLSYLTPRCAAGAYHAERAAAANPYDAFVVTALAGASAFCPGPLARVLLDRAYLIRSDNDVAMRGFLVMATVAQGQEHRLDKLESVLRPPPGPQLPSYFIIESVIATVQGRQEDAIQNWAEFRRSTDQEGLSDDDRLKTIFLSAPVRRRLLEILRQKGVVSS